MTVDGEGSEIKPKGRKCRNTLLMEHCRRKVTSAQCRPHRRQEDSRSAPIEKCHFAALLPLIVLLAAGVPALAADSIEELLHLDEADGHNDALRQDLNALTEEQWQYYFKVERKQPDIELGSELIVRESEERPRVLYIWFAAIAAGFGMAIGAIQASHYLSFRRLCRTVVATADTSHIPPSAPVDIQAGRT